jgi:hypothetical protein
LRRRKSRNIALGVFVPQVASEIRRCWDLLRDSGALLGALAFIVEEEKYLVLQDRPADRAPKSIACELGCLIRSPRSRLNLLDEPVVRREVAVAVILIGAAVETIRTRFRYQGDLRP